MNRKQQGDIGVAMAIAYYTKNNYAVSVPLTDNARYDLLVDNGTITRVQVKTTNQHSIHGIPVVTLSTQGGNQSWDGSIKRIDSAETDLVFVYYLGDKMWEFPVEVCAGKRSLNLGAKQDQYLVTL